jgi:two-component system, NtrC family, sensor histidine kinase PilS
LSTGRAPGAAGDDPAAALADAPPASPRETAPAPAPAPGGSILLERQLKRLMVLRVMMVTTLLLIATYVEAVSETFLEINALYLLIVATYVFTIVHVLALRFVRYLGIQVYAQVVLDLLVITGLVYLTGGPGTRAGFMLLYPLSVLSGSVLLFRRQGLLLAGVATVLHAGLLWAVREGHISPQGLTDVPDLPVKALLYAILLTAVSCATVAMIGGYLAQSLQSVGAQLAEVSEQVAGLQELNELLVESIQSGLMMADAETRIRYLNRYGESVLGRRTQDLRGLTLREFFGNYMFDLRAIRARSRDDRLARLETVFEKSAADKVDLGISVMPLATGDPARGGYLLVFQDLTEIKRLEREVRVKEKLAAVGEMASQLAHEIRNPLGAISGSAQVLMGEANMTGEQGHLLSIITRESKRLSDTLNRFLYQTRPSLGVGTGPVDLGPVFEEAVTLLRNSPEVRPGHNVEFARDEGPHVCLADADQMVQVFWNLARNALEAMPDGGLLTVRLILRDDAIVLSVRDQGKGILGADRGLIFEPFQTRSHVGTGLGLAIVYRIVRDHHGDISVRSAPGQGTEFEVYLPRVIEPAGDSVHRR